MLPPNFVDVEFLAEWMGNPIGAKRKILRFKAEQLEKLGTVKIVNDYKSKSFDAPPVNKMIESAPEKKSKKKSPGRPKKK